MLSNFSISSRNDKQSKTLVEDHRIRFRRCPPAIARFREIGRFPRRNSTKRGACIPLLLFSF